MNAFRNSLALLSVCFLLIGSVAITDYTTSALAGSKGPSALHEELTQARRATARYHDIEQAIADGYENFSLYESGEGHHYVKFSLIDGVFDPTQPEMLLYSPVPGEERLELAGVEYLIPISLSPSAPAGFSGDADQWRDDMEGFGLWELNVWIWLTNPHGIFADRNPRVP
jgi:hypothetical protein